LQQAAIDIMKILLVGNYAPDQQESMLRFGLLLKEMMSAQGLNVRLWQPPVFFGRILVPASLKKWLGYLDKYLFAALSFRKEVGKVDLVHVLDHSNSVYGPWVGHNRWLVTCHDLLAVRAARSEFAEKTRLTGKLLQKWISSSLGKSPYTVCVSATTQSDVQRLLRHDSSKTGVIWNGLNYPYHRRADSEWQKTLASVFISRQLSQPARYIFHIGGNQWYKNRKGVLEIFSRLTQQEAADKDLFLVMAGKPMPPDLQETFERLQLQSRVIRVGNISNEELEALYHGAECLLFPSLAEGFGWPIVEAMACGCRVATSNRAPMTEIGGDVSVYVDPEDWDSAATQVQTLLNESPAQKAERCGAGIARAALFTPEEMAKRYLAAYKQVLAAA